MAGLKKNPKYDPPNMGSTMSPKAPTQPAGAVFSDKPEFKGDNTDQKFSN